jgi:hypothetical protein
LIFEQAIERRAVFDIHIGAALNLAIRFQIAVIHTRLNC